MRYPPKIQILVSSILSLILLYASWQKIIPTSLTETFGFITGAAAVWLAVKENVWTWPVTIISSIFYAFLFYESHLFADMSLQFVYVFFGFLGIYLWLKGGVGKTDLKVRSISKKEALILAIIGIVGTIYMSMYLESIKDSAPFLDALTTTASLIAQYMLVRKHLENWHLWIAVDVIYVYLYISKDLHLTAILYAIFLVMCVFGLKEWKKSKKENLSQAITHK